MSIETVYLNRKNCRHDRVVSEPEKKPVFKTRMVSDESNNWQIGNRDYVFEYTLFLPTIGSTVHTKDFFRRRKMSTQGRRIVVQGRSSIQGCPYDVEADVRIGLPHFASSADFDIKFIILPYRPRDPLFKVIVPARGDPPKLCDLFVNNVLPAMEAIDGIVSQQTSDPSSAQIRNDARLQTYEAHWKTILRRMEQYAARVVEWRKTELSRKVFVSLPEDVVEHVCRFELAPFVKLPWALSIKLLRRLVANAFAAQEAYSFRGRSYLYPVLLRIDNFIADLLERSSADADKLLESCTRDETTIVARFKTIMTFSRPTASVSFELIPSVKEFWEIVFVDSPSMVNKIVAFCLPRAVARFLRDYDTWKDRLYNTVPKTRPMIVSYQCSCEGDALVTLQREFEESEDAEKHLT